MPLASVVLLLLLGTAYCWSPRFIDGIDKQYNCNCVLKGERPQIKEEIVKGTPIESPLVGAKTRGFLSHNYYVVNGGTPMRQLIMKEPSYIERVMSFFRREPEIDEEELLMQKLHDHPTALDSAIGELGKRVVRKYIDRLKNRWNIFDKFDCKCTGNLVDILKSKHYISLSVTHD